MTEHVLALRPFWRRLFPQSWKLAVWLILLWGVPRFVLVLGANIHGGYQWVSLLFLSMWLVPWLFLQPEGRRQIGLRPPRRWGWLGGAMLLGMGYCLLMMLIARILYHETDANWFVYISHTFSPNLPESLNESERSIYFLIFALIGMVFSPIGEELFFRGLVHACFRERWGERRASWLDSLAFAFTHLAHFGIVYAAGSWRFLFWPALWWTGLLVGLCLLFNAARRESGSLFGAIAAHAGYNLAMTFLIFYLLLD